MIDPATLKREATLSPFGAETTAPHLFLVMECQRPRAGGARYALEGVDEVLFGRGQVRAATRERDGGVTRLTVRVPDPLMSTMHARMCRAGAGWEIADLGSTNGTYVRGQKTAKASVEGGALAEIGGTLFFVHDALPTPADATRDLDAASLAGRAHGFATLLPSYARALHALAQVALGALPILLLGESGTGKEVLANGIHALSGRSGALVPVNCGAIPESLVEGQLFGHVKGAFSGAQRDEPGFVRASDRGTLLLDEIGDLPRTSQAALLRVLQEREVIPIGSTRASKVDLRVLSATHRPVDALSSSDAFRSDLFARISGYTHRLLPLRDRRCDLGTLIADLLGRISKDRDFKLAPALGRALFAHDWPLNVRELGHVLGAAATLAADGALDLRHVPEAFRAPRPASAPPREPDSDAPARVLTEEEEELKARLVAALAATNGNVSEVARTMGKTRMQIHRWMRRFDLDPEAHRP